LSALADGRLGACTDPQRDAPVHRFGVKGYTLEVMDASEIVGGTLCEEQSQDVDGFMAM
jgi:hypothetical protein